MREVKWNPGKRELDVVLTEKIGRVLMSDGVLSFEDPLIQVELQGFRDTEWEDQIQTEKDGHKIIFTHLGEGLYEGAIL
jgi:hypothetical protein